MSLDDAEILELNKLCNALVDGTINEDQKARLMQWLSTSEAARRFYVRSMGLSASLFSYAGEMQTVEPEYPALPEKAWNIIRLDWLWRVGAIAAVAAIALVLWLEWPENNQGSGVTPGTDDFVAQLTGSKGCQWADTNTPIRLGERLHKGQILELASGFAEITFDSGAQIVLHGPASFDVKSAWAATLNHGTLKASIPPEAIGFSISNPTVEVVDLGTEFTMFADAIGSGTEVLVLKGEVEAQPKTSADQQQPIVLGEKESRRFSNSGVLNVQDSGREFALFAQPLGLNHFIPPTDYIHWSFDETDGNVFNADASGTPMSAADFHLEGNSLPELGKTHVPGKWDHALRFDGHTFARASFPDISEDTPHTVAFWVNVPKDASLFNAYAMVAWGLNSERSGSHPVHISWNRNPNEGPVGVLRTDYGGGFALGSTPLRDGHWHHIAVVLIPGEDSKMSMQVKQYVDGRLEGEGKASPPGSEIFTRLSSATAGCVWLGCRLGIDGVRQERFRGEMDELYVADRALEPLEIVDLMADNELPSSTLARANK